MISSTVYRGQSQPPRRAQFRKTSGKRKRVSKEDAESSSHYTTSSSEDEANVFKPPPKPVLSVVQPTQCSSMDLFGEDEENLNRSLGESISLETPEIHQENLETYLELGEPEQVSQEVMTINQDITPIFIDLTSDDSSDILRFFIKKMIEKSRTDENFRKGFEVYLKINYT
jgi:hypothetical protein